MGNYDNIAKREVERQKEGKGKVNFKPIVYGEESRCKICWSLLSIYEYENGTTTLYCSNCMLLIFPPSG